MNKPQSYFHLHLISDATGETLIAAGRAAASQYKNARAIEHIYPLVRTARQLAKVFEEIDAEPGIVLYTIVDRELADEIDRIRRNRTDDDQDRMLRMEIDPDPPEGLPPEPEPAPR